MKKVLIRGEITADHVQQLWDAVATADDGEELGVVLDNCTGAQPWAMYAAAEAFGNMESAVAVYVRGDCMSAALPLLPRADWVTADPSARFLPHGADPATMAGRRRNDWQVGWLFVNDALLCTITQEVAGSEHHKWRLWIEQGDHWLNAEQARNNSLVRELGPPPDWARELLEEGGEAA